jgi:hypothetical protein
MLSATALSIQIIGILIIIQTYKRFDLVTQHVATTGVEVCSSRAENDTARHSVPMMHPPMPVMIIVRSRF